jgi:cytochrome c553
MTKEQRGKYMGMVVLPKMREVFRSFDSEKFASIGCQTCHGKDARANGFKMPNAQISQLPNSQEDWGKLMKEKPEWLKFMGEKVKPEMAALLGVPAMDPQNPQPGALGCTACHMMKGK